MRATLLFLILLVSPVLQAQAVCQYILASNQRAACAPDRGERNPYEQELPQLDDPALESANRETGRVYDVKCICNYVVAAGRGGVEGLICNQEKQTEEHRYLRSEKDPCTGKGLCESACRIRVEE